MKLKCNFVFLITFLDPVISLHRPLGFMDLRLGTPDLETVCLKRTTEWSLVCHLKGLCREAPFPHLFPLLND